MLNFEVLVFVPMFSYSLSNFFLFLQERATPEQITVLPLISLVHAKYRYKSLPDFHTNVWPEFSTAQTRSPPVKLLAIFFMSISCFLNRNLNTETEKLKITAYKNTRFCKILTYQYFGWKKISQQLN